MGLFSKLFGKKGSDGGNVIRRENQPDVVNVPTESERMNWGMEKARLTFDYFAKCLASPQPNQQYFSVKARLSEGESVEHIWLGEPEIAADGTISGTIGNNPVYVTQYSLGQRVSISREEVSDWMIIQGGRLIGGYTIRALREGLTGEDLEAFDKNLGGMHVDEGEDYFPHDFSTPEGAILCLEDAYQAKDIEQAIACKDFREEARIMVEKRTKIPASKEILDSTEQLLLVAFKAHFQQNGFPDFTGMTRAFTKREKIDDDHYIITEVSFHPRGTRGEERLQTFLTPNGWRVLGLVSD